MRFLSFIYIIITIVVAASMLFRGMGWDTGALLLGSLLGFAGGSGMRGAIYLRQRTSGFIIGALLLISGMAVLFYSDVVLRVFDVAVSGDVWPLVGFVIGFLAARPGDAGLNTEEVPRLVG
jgi:hypothetical protein